MFFWPRFLSAAFCSAASMARGRAWNMAARLFLPKQSMPPALMTFSSAAALTTRRSTRSQKSKTSRNLPPASRARTIASAAPRPRPLIAVRPNTILPSTTSKSGWPWLTSGGATAIPSLRASAMWSTITSRLFPSSISDDSKAAMNSAVKCVFR